MYKPIYPTIDAILVTDDSCEWRIDRSIPIEQVQSNQLTYSKCYDPYPHPKGVPNINDIVQQVSNLPNKYDDGASLKSRPPKLSTDQRREYQKRVVKATDNGESFISSFFDQNAHWIWIKESTQHPITFTRTLIMPVEVNATMQFIGDKIASVYINNKLIGTVQWIDSSFKYPNFPVILKEGKNEIKVIGMSDTVNPKGVVVSIYDANTGTIYVHTDASWNVDYN